MGRFVDRLPALPAYVPGGTPQIGVRPPHVAIGLPSGDMIHKNHALSLAAMAYSFGMKLTLLDSRSSIITNARNECVKQAQLQKADYLFFIDSDVCFPNHSLVRLLSHKLDIVGATYHRRVPPFDVLGRTLTEGPTEAKSGLLEMAGMPTGLLLIKMSVFDAMKRPYFRLIHTEESEALPEGDTLGEDYYFCNEARKLGFKLHCDIDLSYQVGHVGQWVHQPGANTCRLPYGDAPPPSVPQAPPVDAPKEAVAA